MTCFCLRTSYNLISHGKSETVSAIQEGPIGRFFLMLPRKFPRYTDANGKKKVAGGPGLKQTQLYTAEFGRAIAAWWRAHGPVSTGTGSLPLQTDNVVSSCFLRESMGTCSHDFWWKFKNIASFAAGGSEGDGVLFKALICQRMLSRTAPLQSLWQRCDKMSQMR